MDLVTRVAIADDVPVVRSLLGALSPSALGALRAWPNARLLVVADPQRVHGVAALEAGLAVEADGRSASLVGWGLGVDAPEDAGELLRSAAIAAAAELACVRLTGQPLGEIEIGPGEDPTERFVRAACRAADDIAAATVDLRALPDVGTGADGAATKAADRVAEELALERLVPLGIPICSEERGHIGDPDPVGTWIAVDPIDGTRNYLRDLPPYAFAAGVVEGGVVTTGVVVDLTSGRRWIGRRGRGATVDGRVCRPRPGGPVAVPSVAPGAEVGSLPEGHSRVRMSGSTTVDLCRVADGSLGAFVDLDRAVVHVHDLAGPLAVLREAGVPVLDPTGRPPELVPDPRWTTHLLVGAEVAALPT
ncbi:MAG: inositol monophosphatase family protein [Actinomycetota bacterium]